jgi:methionine sulfoxide reductase catalytic subunit
MSHLNWDKITPEQTYLSRRRFIAGAGAALAAVFLAACARPGGSTPAEGTDFCANSSATGSADELGNILTTCKDVTGYNNFYEFSLNKDDVAGQTGNFKTSPWTVSVGGLVANPGKFTVEELIGKYPPQERIYRMRCVEAWSMVVPWIGFPLSSLLADLKPTSDAKYVRFEGLLDPSQMPGQSDHSFPWPYVEGLRIDEANHYLTLLATGLYNKPLPAQDGAPIRLVVPWKYGFKNIKSIVKIDLVADMPATFWPRLSPFEYGFFANVNPNVPHPRWSQASERRIGEVARRPTQIFNGYNQVASLYDGMDLTKNF